MEDEELDNVYDFIEFKMHKLIERVALAGREDLALALSEALDSYLMGEISISFIDGWPVAYESMHIENPNDNE
jgi:hypothetical protein